MAGVRPHPNAQQPVRADGPRAAGSSGAPTTIYVDWAKLESTASPDTAARLQAAGPDRPIRRPARLVTTVDAELAHVRRNVKDSAKAVLAWFAAVVGHQGPGNLDEVLNRCLRPGPDVQSVNYAAIAQEIQRTLHVTMTPKRVRTAIGHLRRNWNQRPKASAPQRSDGQFEALRSQLEANYRDLIAATPDHRLRRQMACQVLAAVRCAASRLIENDFGQSIPTAVDLEHLEGRFLDLVRLVNGAAQRGGRPAADALRCDLHRLLVAMCDYDGSAEQDMQLVGQGSRVVTALMGPYSLPGLLGQLNVLVAGRHWIPTERYVLEMWHLARRASKLHEDPATRSLMHWVRRQSPDRRWPSPMRLASYCLNNAATRIYDRIFQAELEPAGRWLKRARRSCDRMQEHDSGFALIKTTQLIRLTGEAKLTGDAGPVKAHFARLGRDRTLQLLSDLNAYDNCDAICRAAERHAVAVFADLKHHLIRVG